MFNFWNTFTPEQKALSAMAIIIAVSVGLYFLPVWVSFAVFTTFAIIFCYRLLVVGYTISEKVKQWEKDKEEA